MSHLVPKKVIFIQGTPRSGSSWLGQIFNSVPTVAYKYQPLFSYAYKNIISSESSQKEILTFLNEVFENNSDEFINQLDQKNRGVHPKFTNAAKKEELVIKMVRHHYLTETFIKSVKGIKIIGIVRHPCGVINSWLKTPREFKPEWDQLEEWRDANLKNQGRLEEYYGFEKWKELSHLFIDLEKKYPDNFTLVQYEKIVDDPMKMTKKLFSFAGIHVHSQTSKFLKETHTKEIEDPDTAYRLSDVKSRWKKELNPIIKKTILNEVENSDLARFLVE